MRQAGQQRWVNAVAGWLVGASCLLGQAPALWAWSVTLEAETMTKTTGGAVTDGWNLWSNGTLSQTITVPAGATYTFQIVARGDFAGSELPKMEVRDDWVVLATVSVDSNTAWKTFTVKGWLPGGSRTIRIAFINDYYNPPADRNLLVDKIIISDGAALDTTAPTVSLTAPAAGATVSGTISVGATASDNVGVAGVQFQLDGVNLGAEDVASPYSLTWDTAPTANGSHALTAIARDAAGNRATSAAVTVTVSRDTTPPVITITSPKNGDIITAP